MRRYTKTDGPGPTSDSSHRGSILIENRFAYAKAASPDAWPVSWLSWPRLSPYLEACSNDMGKALELYEWNISLAQVLQRDISHFEVALRNAYDGLMASRWDGDWLLDDDSPARKPIMRASKRGPLDINRINRRIIDSASASLPKGHGHDDLVAALTLGFWVHLTDRSREQEIWRTNLYLAWPKGTNRTELQQRLNGILRTRNRVAHPEHLFNPRTACPIPTNVDRNAIELFCSLCPPRPSPGRGGGSPARRE